MTRTIVETERLVVRALAPEDVEPLAALRSGPAATAHLGGARSFDDVCGTLTLVLDFGRTCGASGARRRQVWAGRHAWQRS